MAYTYTIASGILCDNNNQVALASLNSVSSDHTLLFGKLCMFDDIPWAQSN